MMAANANALTAAGMAAFAAGELHFHGFHDDAQGIKLAAAEAVAPLLRSAAIALELAGLTAQECGGGVHDVIIDYITAASAAPPHHVHARGIVA